MGLIEVNSSPATDYSTPVTKKLVKETLTDTMKVVWKFKGKERHPHSMPHTSQDDFEDLAHKNDFGKWSLIHRDPAVERNGMNVFIASNLKVDCKPCTLFVPKQKP